jgi:hypothetical protein
MAIEIGSGVLADLARVNIKYLLEWHKNGSLYTSIALPLPPSAISIQQTAPVEIMYSITGKPIRQLGEYKRKFISIEGSSGYQARRGFDKNGAIIFEQGSIILEQFKLFLAEYQEVVSKSSKNLFPIKDELIFRALDENYHLYVEVQDFTYQRDSQSAHFSTDWTLSLSAYADAEKTSLFPKLEENLNTVKAVISDFNSGLAFVSSVIEGARGLADSVLTTFDSLKNSALALNDVFQGINSILDLPSDVVGKVAQTAQSFRTVINREIRKIEDLGESYSAKYNALKTALLGAEDLDFTVSSLSVFVPFEEDNLDSFSLYTTQNNYLTSYSSTPIRNDVSIYRLNEGEDLRVLARRFFGDAERWPELASINGWISFNRLSNGRFLQSGDIVLLPVLDTTNQTNINDIFGLDLYLKEGDVVFAEDDLRTISGIPNLEQGITLRLQAISEETPIFESYGLPILTGRRLTPSFSGYLGSYVRNQLSRDLRVLEVVQIDVVDKGDNLDIYLKFTSNDTALIETKVIL